MVAKQDRHDRLNRRTETQGGDEPPEPGTAAPQPEADPGGAGRLPEPEAEP